MPDRRTPFVNLGERDTLVAFLDYLRDGIVGAVEDPAAMCARGPGDIDPLPLRWVLVHMVEETGRHAGHADILREQLDGETGR
jgi:hypothetical protein